MEFSYTVTWNNWDASNVILINFLWSVLKKQNQADDKSFGSLERSGKQSLVVHYVGQSYAEAVTGINFKNQTFSLSCFLVTELLCLYRYMLSYEDLHMKST